MEGAYTNNLCGLTPDEIENYEERAAIMEHLGGLSKGEAENLALVIVGREREQKLRQLREGEWT